MSAPASLCSDGRASHLSENGRKCGDRAKFTHSRRSYPWANGNTRWSGRNHLLSATTPAAATRRCRQAHNLRTWDHRMALANKASIERRPPTDRRRCPIDPPADPRRLSGCPVPRPLGLRLHRGCALASNSKSIPIKASVLSFAYIVTPSTLACAANGMHRARHGASISVATPTAGQQTVSRLI